MNNHCTIQLHAAGAWLDVASVSLLGDAALGWRCAAYGGYDAAWSVAHWGARDAHALSCRWPVGLEPLELSHWPVFLIDMLPQGFGRQEMLRRLGLSPLAEASADWSLLHGGAANPIGHLRVKEAAQWLASQAGAMRGFSEDEVASRGEGFAEYLASHGLFVAGSSGVQGEWPKILMTRGHDGLLYLDHTLPDEQAAEHFIVKFARGTDAALASILRHEAPWMALAQRLGLRVHGSLVLRERALFIPRFDRQVMADGCVLRLAQESIASLTGMPGLDAVPSHDAVCRQLLAQCSDPQAEVLEYIKRDVANLALGNKDNHARNTAVQRDFEGHVALTPLFDFAPMYLHPDGIARRIRWQDNDGGQPDWGRVIRRICELSVEVSAEQQAGNSKLLDHAALVAGLKEMVQPLREIAAHGGDLGMESGVHAFLRPHLEARARELEALL